MGDIKDLKFRHVAWPSVFSFILIFSTVLLVDENKAPGPMSIALLASLLTAPLLCVITKSGDKKEHAIGVGVISVPMAIFWSLGPNYFNMAAPFFVWIWQCATWPKKSHPPFRYGIWHGFGIAACLLPYAVIVNKLI
tara:strand:- start:18466 stop:18876 length:411 start_codon:yes stop_codon:yes gene_type:complete